MGSPKQESTPKRQREAADIEAMIERMLQSLVRRAEGGDLDALVALVRLHNYSDGCAAGATVALRRQPWSYSWTDIGNALGITKQAAQQRFGS